jgi:hypothetical protein
LRKLLASLKDGIGEGAKNLRDWLSALVRSE